MKIRHRYLPFHTRTVGGDGLRTDGRQPETVFENEIVVDVGGKCRGWQGETLWIFDHHFHREEGNFPSAAAAVLHHAAEISSAFRERDEIWIATHEEPDFDAFCASYLVRSLLLGELSGDAGEWRDLGLNPEGWEDLGEGQGGEAKGKRIDWFRPRIAREDPRRWAVLLASYASCVDQGKTIRCERSRALHAVLYAGLVRGRDFTHDGAAFFFERARKGIDHRELNPLIDPLFDSDGPFAPELELLSHESDRYLSDLARARRGLVTVPVASVPFADWFGKLIGTDSPPAFEGEPGEEAFRVNPDHLALVPGGESRAVDAIYLRDPECILFKEWARQDFENSCLGKGFTFTAIAYSGEKPGAERGNPTDYYFALDPERADGAHLYTLWLALQLHEIESLDARSSGEAREEKAREGFVERAGNLGGWFKDPWFDGHNFQATIIATPTLGTAIPAGRRPDLGDDPVVEVVVRVLEYSIFASESGKDGARVEVSDFSCASDGGESSRSFPVEDGISASLCPTCLRFVSAHLKSGVDLEVPGVGERVGRLLWPFLEVEGVRGVPSDFLASHLCVHSDHVIVWNRRGAAIARVVPPGEGVADSPSPDSPEAGLRSDLAGLASVTGDIQRLVADHKSGARGVGDLIRDGQSILRQLAELKLAASIPEKRAFREILKRSGCDDSVAVVHALNVRAAEDDEAQRDKELQRILNGAFFLLGVPSIVLCVIDVIGQEAFTDLAGSPFAESLVNALLKWEWVVNLGKVAMPVLESLLTGPSAWWGGFVAAATLVSFLFGAVLWWWWSRWLGRMAKK